MRRGSADVVIVGAGVAGLAAAADLERAGAEVVVLEARARAGGRIWTSPGRPPLERGAEFLPAQGEAARLLADAGASLEPVAEGHSRLVRGRLEPTDFEKVVERGVSAIEAAVESALPAEEDCTVAEALALAEVDPTIAAATRSYVEQYHAAPVDHVSARWLLAVEASGEGGGGGSQVRVLDGLDRLVHVLGGAVPPARIRTGHTVLDVTVDGARADGPVRVSVRDAEGDVAWAATAAVLALPVPILRKQLSRTTVIPEPQARALAGLGMGKVVKLAMRFRRPFWREAAGADGEEWDGISFLHSDGPFRTWWTSAAGSALVAWVGGPAALELLRSLRSPPDQRVDRLVRTATAQLGEMVGRSPERVGDEIEEIACHGWTDDPHAGGAYPYARPGAADAARVLAEPIADRLFVAGDAVAEEMGTVEGALRSGRDAARSVVGRLG